MYKIREKILTLFPKKRKRRRTIVGGGKRKNTSTFINNSEKKFKKRKTQLKLHFDRFYSWSFLKKNKKIYYSIGLGGVILGIIIVIFGPYFKIKNINILRKDNLSNINISYKAIDNIRGKSIFGIQEKQIEEKIKAYQQNIKNIEIGSVLPNNLKITIESYKGVFHTTINKKPYIITENGSLIPSKSDGNTRGIEIINSSSDEVGKFIDYKKIFEEKYISEINEFVEKLEENIINIDIQKISYYLIEREVHIQTPYNLLLFSLDERVLEQVEKTVIFHKQYQSLDKYGIYYTDMRIPNKIFYCSMEQELQCRGNMKRIYEQSQNS